MTLLLTLSPAPPATEQHVHTFLTACALSGASPPRLLSVCGVSCLTVSVCGSCRGLRFPLQDPDFHAWRFHLLLFRLLLFTAVASLPVTTFSLKQCTKAPCSGLLGPAGADSVCGACSRPSRSRPLGRGWFLSMCSAGARRRVPALQATSLPTTRPRTHGTRPGCSRPGGQLFSSPFQML